MGCLRLTYYPSFEVLKGGFTKELTQEKSVSNLRTTYIYAYNGMEVDNEVSGNGNSYTTEFRQYDPRIGRWLSIDPEFAQAPWNSPYVSMSNNPILRIDPLGNVDDEYTVDKQGNVTKVKDTDDNFDRLHTEENYESGDLSKGVTVDKGLLTQLDTKSYAESTDKDDLFKVTYFMMENTDVEWGAYGFRQEDNSTLYVMGTSHEKGQVGIAPAIISSYGGIFNMTFDLHSHPSPTGTKGGSGNHMGSGGDHIGDMSRITGMYNKYKSAGMKNIHTWFEYDGKNIKFPSFYLYHKESNTLYHYTPFDNDIFIRNVNSSDDLYRNLGL